MRFSPWLLPLLGLAFFLALGTPPLFDLDEGAFTEATREMLASGNYLTTYLNGAPRFDKPILIYWLQAGSATLFGLSEWSLRLPSALAASAWTLALYGYLAPRSGREAALAAASFQATSLGVLLIGRAATADALLNLWLALTLLDMLRYRERASTPTLLRIYLWMGLGVLTKGPVALLIPLAASFIDHALRGAWADWLRAALHPGGWLIFIGVAAPWYVLEYLDQGQAFIDGFFLTHNVGRLAATMEGHGGHWHYYLWALPLVLLPYSGLLWHLRSGWSRDHALPLAWFGVVFLLFSVSGTQLPHYILYGATPLFLLFARHLGTRIPPWLVWIAPGLFWVAMLALPELADRGLNQAQDAYMLALRDALPESLGRHFRAGAMVAAVLTVATAIFWRRKTARALVGAGLIQAAFIALVLGPAVGRLQQQPVKEAALLARGLDRPVVMWGLNMPSFSVYRGAITERRAPRRGELAFTRVDALDSLAPHRVLYRKAGILLVEPR